MTRNANRVLAALLTGAVVVIAAMLVLGLSGATIGSAPGGSAERAPVAVEETTSQEQFDQNLDEVSHLMTAERDASYLAGLRVTAPALWADATDAQIVEMGRVGCTLAAQNGGDWTEGVEIMNSAGFDPRDTGVLVFHAVQNFCPNTTF